MKITMAVGIGKIQEQLVRSGRMSTEELDDFSWSVVEEESGPEGRRFMVFAQRIKPPPSARPQRNRGRAGPVCRPPGAARTAHYWSMDADAPIDCPGCGSTVKLRLSDWAKGKTVKCRNGHEIKLEGKQAKEAARALNDLEKTLKKLGK